ncbi:MAG: hypothetical protein JKX92_10805 [Porticoccaceae bacterium]|nr:hypothetical protein [Porticoccaceae bacterium]
MKLIPALAISLFLLVGANFSIAAPGDSCSETNNPNPGKNCTCVESSDVPECNVSG